MKALFKRWDQFLFAEISIIPLDIFRRIFGLLVLTDLIALFPSRYVWWSEHGILSEEGAIRYLGSFRINLLNYLPATDACLTAFILLIMVAAVLLIAGRLTRLSSLIVFFGLVSLTHRNSMILNSGDTFLRMCSFWLIWAPTLKEPHQKMEAWRIRLLQIQFMIVYLMTFICKMQGSMWLNGTAVGYVLKLEEFKRFPLPDFVFVPWMVHLETWGTLLIEGALGVLIWVPQLRLWMILAALILHLGIEYSMNIPLFEWVMMGSLTLFLTEEDWKRIRGLVYHFWKTRPRWLN